MAIFGSLIKSLIEIKENFTSEEDAVKQQEEVLRELLKKSAGYGIWETLSL